MTIHFPPFLAVQSSRVSFLLDLKRLPFSSKCLLFLISIQSKLLLMTTKNAKIESGHLREVVTYNIESNNSGSLPRRLRSQHIYILEQNSSRAISNLQYVYSFMVSLQDFHILWVVYYIQQTTKKSLTMIQGKQIIMSLLCTAQTVWNKGLKKHWFPIVAMYGTCIMGRWTCL